MARGGKRIGAGRKTGSLTVKTQKIAEQASAQGMTPLEVMLSNMRHFQQIALDAEAIVEGLTAEEFSGKEMPPDEQFKLMLAQVKKAAGLRVMAQECARDAAAYIHPRLSAVNHSGEIKYRPAAQMSDDELATIATERSEGTAEAPVDPSQLN